MDEYISQLLKDAGVPESTDSEVMAHLSKDIKTKAMDLINKRLVESLEDNDLKTFDNILQEQPQNLEVMQQFITDHVPNKEQVVGAALLEFRALYLGAAA